ncbi:MAG: thrombospondin type 3 repeat-containing protein, partial [Pseudomonadales bacterium]|nr:thrombospondin type 3 repeat-containing protein [Pseudomonadales bacterium]
LADGVSGTSRIAIKRTLSGAASYSNSPAVTAFANNWVQLTWDYTHSASDDTFVYIKGPVSPASGKEFYIDDFYIVPQGSPVVDFSTIGDVVDIGAYEFQDSGQDSDNDSINDDLDNCPNTPNNDQLNLDGDAFGDACDNDIDGDGVLDVNDNCPSVANADQQDSDNDLAGNVCDSTPNGDSDLDTIDNATDNCPAVANTDQNDIDQDNKGDVCDLDIDGDGVPNAIETAVGTNPNNANDAAVAAQAVIDALESGGGGDVEEIQIPMVGGFGLLALGLSMLGLGALRIRRK